MKPLILTVLVTLAASVVPATAVAGQSTLQRDADAIRAAGVTGVLARETSPQGSRTAERTAKTLVDNAICD